MVKSLTTEKALDELAVVADIHRDRLSLSEVRLREGEDGVASFARVVLVDGEESGFRWTAKNGWTGTLEPASGG